MYKFGKNIKKENYERYLDELKLCVDNYRYRDQLMVTEFGLTMTAYAIAYAATRFVSGIEEILIFSFVSLFLLVISNHIWRVNQDRCSAGDRMKNIQKKLSFPLTHEGLSGNRKGISAPVLIVWFIWLATLTSFFKTFILLFAMFYNK